MSFIREPSAIGIFLISAGALTQAAAGASPAKAKTISSLDWGSEERFHQMLVDYAGHDAWSMIPGPSILRDTEQSLSAHGYRVQSAKVTKQDVVDDDFTHSYGFRAEVVLVAERNRLCHRETQIITGSFRAARPTVIPMIEIRAQLAPLDDDCGP